MPPGKPKLCVDDPHRGWSEVIPEEFDTGYPADRPGPPRGVCSKVRLCADSFYLSPQLSCSLSFPSPNRRRAQRRFRFIRTQSATRRERIWNDPCTSRLARRRLIPGSLWNRGSSTQPRPQPKKCYPGIVRGGRFPGRFRWREHNLRRGLDQEAAGKQAVAFQRTVGQRGRYRLGIRGGKRRHREFPR
jgi:hypothetical protein